MIREEAIEILADKVKPCLSGTDWNDAIDMAIKALEQEPTDKNFTKADIDAMVKAINEGWKLRVNEILDKIRAEIIEDCGYSKDYVGAFTYSTIKLKTVLQIIDKYKAEMRREDGND